MANTLIFVALFCVAGLVSAASAEPSYYPSYVYPVEHRSNLRSLQEVSDDPDDYEFQIVPSDQYGLAQLDVVQNAPPAFALSLWDFVPSPITAVATVAKFLISKALFVLKHVISKGIWIALGAGLVIGFCAFTPYCTLIIEKPFARELRSLGNNVPYLDEIEGYFYQAYDKLHEMYG